MEVPETVANALSLGVPLDYRISFSLLLLQGYLQDFSLSYGQLVRPVNWCNQDWEWVFADCQYFWTLLGFLWLVRIYLVTFICLQMFADNEVTDIHFFKMHKDFWLLYCGLVISSSHKCCRPCCQNNLLLEWRFSSVHSISQESCLVSSSLDIIP